MATSEPRLTTQTLRVLGALMSCPQAELSGAQIGRTTNRVLGALMSCPQAELSGAQIGRTTKLPTGTLYPILLRLDQAGWVKSRWEEGDPHILGRPRRRFYRITALGERNAAEAAHEIRTAFGTLAWS